MSNLFRRLLLIAGAIGLSGGLTLVDGRNPSWAGWLAYLVVVGLCAVAAWLSWLTAAKHRFPRWLPAALLLAFGLRLGLAIAFTHVLPQYGSGRGHQEAGYFYPDAYDRDRIAWELGRSNRPLWELTERERRVDQYGGLLIWSAIGYRFLSTDAHRPLLIGLQAATASALTVLFTWALVSLAFGSVAAAVASWVVALYPEAILLGSSQMREPFLGLGFALMVYGHLQIRQGALRRGGALAIVGGLLSLLISPPAALVNFGILLVLWLWERRASWKPPAWAWVALAVGMATGFVLTTRAWSSAGVWGRNALDVFLAWVCRTAQYELHVLETGSGMVQAVFDRTPAWAHVPLATAYGLVRPFLPAALFEPAAPLARVVEVLRALGWFFLLPLLTYALAAGPRTTGWRSLPTGLALIVWLGAIGASFRGGGDGWDNVRYRATFLVMQAAVAGWAWAQACKSGSPWLRRIAGLVAVETVIFSQWYAGRYLGTPGFKLEATALLAITTLGLMLLAFIVRDRKAGKRLTG